MHFKWFSCIQRKCFQVYVIESISEFTAVFRASSRMRVTFGSGVANRFSTTNVGTNDWYVSQY